MPITLLSKSPQLIDANLGEDTTLFIGVSSSATPLTYEWYDVLNERSIGDNTPILTLDQQSAEGVFRVTVTDNNGDIYVSEDFIVNNRQLFQGGLSPADKVLAAREDTVPGKANIADNIHIKGGYHQYDSIDSLIDASANYRRIQYGQYGFVEFNKAPIIGNTPQTRTAINRVYKCKISNPLLRFKQYTDEAIRINVSDTNNAKNWSYTTTIDPAITQEAVLTPIFSNNTLTGVNIVTQGIGYNRFKTFVGVYTTDDVDLSTATLRATVNTAGSITNVTLVNGPISGFTTTPTIKIFGGDITKATPTPIPPFLWTVGETFDADADWVPVTFLNAEPDNDTIIIENGLVKASIPAADTWDKTQNALNVITPTYDMTKLVGHNAIKVLEDVIYPYQNVTINLTAFNNASPVDTLIENGNTITITRVFAEIKNYENLLNNSFVKLSGVYSIPGSNQSITELTTISKDTIVDNNGFVNFTVGIISHPLPINNVEGYSVTLSAGGKEYGENFDGETNTHNVYGQQQIDWAHRIYYFKDSNASITGNLSIPVDAGRTDPTLSPKGVYTYPRTETPEYVWLFVPSTMTLTEIGLPEENIPFYQYATQDGNKFLTTTVNITVGSKQYTYKGYRSYNKTASDVNVTIL